MEKKAAHHTWCTAFFYFNLNTGRHEKQTKLDCYGHKCALTVKNPALSANLFAKNPVIVKKLSH